MRHFSKLLAAVLAATMAVEEAAGQSSTGGLRGTVTDAGGSVPGATVSLVNETTQGRRSTTTNARGEYAFADLAPGTYSLSVALIGYKTVEKRGLEVAADVLTVDASLEIGARVETVVVVGTRRADRTVGTSTTPIDVFKGEDLVRVGASNLNDALRAQVVAFNVQRFVAQDGSAFVRPFTLRGLPPDQTLVLVNGKRRHRSALVQITNQPLAAGAQGPDMQAIPAIAVEAGEVLRDGAAAQYGSDAIAGVINFRLKREKGFTVSTRGGQYFEGDGDEYSVQAYAGLPLPREGFFSLSGEYARAKPTSRGAQRPDAQALIDAGNRAVPVPAQRWGNVNTEAVHVVLNAELPTGETSRLYSFGNWSRSEGDTEFFYRSPTGRLDIFRSVPLTSQPGGTRFSFVSQFPGGFTPIFGTKIGDRALTAGFTGLLGSGLTYDLSGGLAENQVDYRLSNTVNPSVGPDSPTSFEPGTVKQREARLNADFVYAWKTGAFAAPLSIAYGLEWRDETFEIEPGDPASYRVGPFARVRDPDTGGFVGLAVGSSGFPGYNPSIAGTFSRSNWAAYADLETDVVARLTLAAAARYEDFSDFGGTFNWKISSRLKLAKGLAVRGSVNTGFRAPTPGQSNIADVATNIDIMTGGLLLTATRPPSDPIAQFYGARPLTPENSRNWSGGLVLDVLGGYVLTVDYFDIRVDERIALTSRIPITAADRAALAARGLDPGDLQTVRFFGNFFDSRTRGVDAVLTKRWGLSGGSSLGLTTAVNHTTNKVTNVRDARAVDRERRIEISDFNPKTRGNAFLDYERARWHALVGVGYYGRWTDAVPNAVPTALSFDQTFGAKWLVDVDLSRRFLADRLTVSVGGANVFDAFPDEDRRPGQRNNGIVYPQFSPFGFSGGSFYARATARF